LDIRLVIRGRSFGAITGQLRDTTYEQKITELEQKVEQLTKEKEEFKIQRDAAIAKLAEITTTEPPVKKGFNALG